MIIGIDPGSLTGLVIVERVIDSFEITTRVQFSPSDFVRAATQLLTEYRRIEVVCERYDITPDTVRKSRNRDPYHVEGWLRFHCEFHHVPFHQVSRSDAKKFASDDHLKRTGWYTPGRDHINDATRQAVTHLAGVNPTFVNFIASQGWMNEEDDGVRGAD